MALGRDNVVHLALADDAAAERIVSILARLLHFRGIAPAQIDGEPALPGHRDDVIEIEG